jgi:hypothetical protein
LLAAAVWAAVGVALANAVDVDELNAAVVAMMD